MPHLLPRATDTLSGGELQRVALSTGFLPDLEEKAKDLGIELAGFLGLQAARLLVLALDGLVHLFAVDGHITHDGREDS